MTQDCLDAIKQNKFTFHKGQNNRYFCKVVKYKWY